MQSQLNEVQDQLLEVQLGLRSVFKALDFLQGFIESDYGMRFQFQAYKSTSPIYEQVNQELQTLRTKYSEDGPYPRTNAQQVSSLLSTSLSRNTGPSASATVVGGDPSYQSYGNQSYSQPQSTSFASHFMSTSSTSSSNAFQYHQDYNPQTSQTFTTTADFQPSQQVEQIDVKVEPHHFDDDDYDTGNEDQSSALDEDDSEASNSNSKRGSNKKKVNSTREKIKMLRMRGEAYIGYTKVEREDGKRHFVTARPNASRKLGPPCSSQQCAKSKVRHCQEFPEDIREALFKQFWQEFDWDQKRNFVSSNVKRGYIKRTTVPVGEKRRKTEIFNYFLPLGDKRLQVCRIFFKSTMGIRDGMLTMWVKQLNPLPEVKPEPIVVTRKGKGMKKSPEERPSPKQEKPPKPGYKCPYCRDLFSTRSDVETHLSKHFAQYDTGKE